MINAEKFNTFIFGNKICRGQKGYLFRPQEIGVDRGTVYLIVDNLWAVYSLERHDRTQIDAGSKHPQNKKLFTYFSDNYVDYLRDSKSDNHMSMARLMLRVLIITTLWCGPLWAQSSAFDRADVNDDARVDRDEFNRIIIDRFNCRDQNNDGAWSLPECRGPDRTTLDAADTDNDERISRDELSAWGDRRFDRLDRNRDGYLGIQEYKEWGLSDM